MSTAHDPNRTAEKEKKTRPLDSKSKIKTKRAYSRKRDLNGGDKQKKGPGKGNKKLSKRGGTRRRKKEKKGCGSRTATLKGANSQAKGFWRTKNPPPPHQTRGTKAREVLSTQTNTERGK